MESAKQYVYWNISGVGNLDQQGIIKAVKQGGRFLIFKYYVSFLFFSIEKLSPAILVQNKEEMAKMVNKYNTICLLWGVWSISGLFQIWKAMRTNNLGGVDVTDDILLNTGTLNLDEKNIKIEKVDTLFQPFPKDELLELKGALENWVSSNRNIDSIYGGEFVNVDTRCTAPYVIFYQGEPKEKEAIQEQVYTRFRKFVDFDIIESREDFDLFEKCTRQGDFIAGRKGQKTLEKRVLGMDAHFSVSNDSSMIGGS